MPEFFWRAVDAQGQVQEGRQEAASAPAVQKWLRGRHLTPLEIREPQARDAAPPGAASHPAWPRWRKGGGAEPARAP